MPRSFTSQHKPPLPTDLYIVQWTADDVPRWLPLLGAAPHVFQQHQSEGSVAGGAGRAAVRHPSESLALTLLLFKIFSGKSMPGAVGGLLWALLTMRVAVGRDTVPSYYRERRTNKRTPSRPWHPLWRPCARRTPPCPRCSWRKWVRVRPSSWRCNCRAPDADCLLHAPCTLLHVCVSLHVCACSCPVEGRGGASCGQADLQC